MHGSVLFLIFQFYQPQTPLANNFFFHFPLYYLEMKFGAKISLYKSYGMTIVGYVTK